MWGLSNVCLLQPKACDSKTRDRILRILARPETGQYSPDFGAISSLKTWTKWEKSTGESSKIPVNKIPRSWRFLSFVVVKHVLLTAWTTLSVILMGSFLQFNQFKSKNLSVIICRALLNLWFPNLWFACGPPFTKMTKTTKTLRQLKNKELSAEFTEITEPTEMTKTTGMRGANHGFPKQRSDPPKRGRKNGAARKLPKSGEKLFDAFLTIFDVFCPARRLSKSVEKLLDTF